MQAFHTAQYTQQSTPPTSFSVSEVNNLVADAISATLPNTLSVEGEISNYSAATSGHRYFSLKDVNSTISCAMFRGAANRISRDILQNLKNGDKVVVKANLSVYQPRGSYQLIVNDIEPAGFGALAKAFAELKQKLDNAGLTAIERKRDIPTWATSIAVVTSATGAAVRDVLTTLERRAPFIPVNVYPTLVQGQTAPEQIIQALTDANNNMNASVILLVRGGGSLEDLQAFNDESVAMAVVNSRLPVISGVGHETDFTIVDFVSDARAPTPTAAAEWVSPDKVALATALHKQKQRLQLAISGDLTQRRQRLSTLSQRLSVQHPERGLLLKNQRLDELATRLQARITNDVKQRRVNLNTLENRLRIQHPKQRLSQSRQQLSQLEQRLNTVITQRIDTEKSRLLQAQSRLENYPTRLERYQQQIKGLEARLTLLSPLGVLGRGYALAFDGSGDLLKNAEDIAVGETLRVRLGQGKLTAVVESRDLI